MPSLDEVQTLFVQAVVHNDSNALSRICDEALADEKRFSAQRRMRVYSDAFRIRLVNALAEQYPNTLKAVGGEAFEGIAIDYIAMHRPNSWTLRDLGMRFPEFIATSAESHLRPYLSDLARIEWAYVEAFDAADCAPLALESLGAVPPEDWPNLRFKATPSVIRIQTEFDLEPMLADLAADRPSSMPNRRSVCWIVWRASGGIRRMAFDNSETQAMEKLIAGKTFGEVCDSLERSGEAEAADKAVGMLRRLVEGGALGQFAVSAD